MDGSKWVKKCCHDGLESDGNTVGLMIVSVYLSKSLLADENVGIDRNALLILGGNLLF